MRRRYVIYRRVRVQPRGLLGCFLLLLGLAGLASLGALLFLPLLWIALGAAGVAAVLAAARAVYRRLKGTAARLLGRPPAERRGPHEGRLPEGSASDAADRPRKRLSVQVRRRPHRGP
jgi:hypothetical protein